MIQKMEPENTLQNKSKKKFLVISLVAIAVVSSVIVLLIRNYTTLQIPEAPPVAQEKKAFTEAEKEEILTQLSKSIPENTISQKEKERTLLNLSRPIPVTTISDEEKQRILEALMSTQGQ